MDEKLLIKRILQGDTHTFSYFVTTYQDMAITIAYRVSGNMLDAEDITQDAFVKAFHNLHSFRVDSKFSTWFYRIVYNTAITNIKGAFQNTEFIDYKELNESNSSEWNIIEQIEEEERKEMLTLALQDMPKEDSLLLTLFYMDENSVKEVAQITSLSEANVRVKLHRARKKLAENLNRIVANEEI